MAKTSTETMGALLSRKQKVTETMDAPRPEAPRPIILPAKPTPRPDSPNPKPVVAPLADENAPQSTTERLLARKRKRQEGDDKS